jgi:hypothetical protein
MKQSEWMRGLLDAEDKLLQGYRFGLGFDRNCEYFEGFMDYFDNYKERFPNEVC